MAPVHMPVSSSHLPVWEAQREYALQMQMASSSSQRGCVTPTQMSSSSSQVWQPQGERFFLHNDAQSGFRQPGAGVAQRDCSTDAHGADKQPGGDRGDGEAPSNSMASAAGPTSTWAHAAGQPGIWAHAAEVPGAFTNTSKVPGKWHKAAGAGASGISAVPVGPAVATGSTSAAGVHGIWASSPGPPGTWSI